MKFAKNLVLTAALVVAGDDRGGGRETSHHRGRRERGWSPRRPRRRRPVDRRGLRPAGPGGRDVARSCAVHRCRGAAHPGRPGLTRHAGDEGERGSAPRHRATAVLFVAAWRSRFNQIARALGARWKAALPAGSAAGPGDRGRGVEVASVLDSGVQLLHEARQCGGRRRELPGGTGHDWRPSVPRPQHPYRAPVAVADRASKPSLAARTQELLVGLVLAVTLTAPDSQPGDTRQARPRPPSGAWLCCSA